ncbi:hypothetical protein PG994_005332 [Apiospora phragmitis]|uniref:Uncharacterized protein n=1 Tax=Apiospora phragmitis TaxID=2905665 RepID=A0ABR1VBX7_9PEZI
MQFNLAIATAIMAYVAQAAPADSCTKTFSVCKAQAGTDAGRNAACDTNRAQCIGHCQTTTSSDDDLMSCTGLNLEMSKEPQSAVARRSESCTKTFSVCKAQAGTDAGRNAACDTNRAQCIGHCQTTTSSDDDLMSCTGLNLEMSKEPQSAVARRSESCTKTFSVCKAQAGTDAERNAACDTNRAQCIGHCQTTTSSDDDLMSCTGLNLEMSKEPQSATA